MPVLATESESTKILDEQTTGTELNEITEINITLPKVEYEVPFVDLAEKEAQAQVSKMSESNLSEFSGETYKKNIDLSRSAPIPLESETPSTRAVVGNPELYVLNPETMKNGQYTTETMFLIATRVNGQDLCYDTSGGPLNIVFNNTFPSGYIMQYNDGQLAGFVLLMFNEGLYPFTFALTTQDGSMSPAYSMNFEIVRRGYFESFSDSFSSVSDSKEYSISVDYSKASTYQIGLARLGESGATVTVYNPDNTSAGSCYVTGNGTSQSVKASVLLNKPTNVSGLHTYRVVVTPDSKNYVEGDTAFRLAYGEASQSQYFFEDVSDSINLPYFTTRRGNQNSNEYTGYPKTMSDYGHWYKITATGTEAVTLGTTHENTRFKILDAQSYETLYDSYNVTPVSFFEYSGYYTKVLLNFAEGKDYYVVVYPTNPATWKGAYTITVGQNRVIGPVLQEVPIPKTAVTKGVKATWNFTLNTPNGNPGYIDQIAYTSSGAGWPYEGGYYEVLSPGTYTWKSNPGMYYSDIKYNYTDINTKPVAYKGSWGFRFTPAQSGTYPGTTLKMWYYFEV